MLNIVCIGAGVMSSAFSVAQTENKVSIIPAPFDDKTVARIQQTGFDDRLDVSWPNIDFVDHSIQEIDLIVIGVSSLGISWALDVVKKLSLNKKVPILLLTKGLIAKEDRLLTLSDYIEKEVSLPVISVTGPCIAKQLALGYRTEVLMSSKDISELKDVVSQLQTSSYIIHTSNDYIGAEFSAALKNVYAISIAMASDNTNLKSARFSQALMEMSEWVCEAGGRPETVYGLSGSGDLYVTTQGGRNGQMGEHLAKGLSLQAVLEGPMKGVTVEGVELAKLVQPFAKSKGLFSELMKVLDGC